MLLPRPEGDVEHEHTIGGLKRKRAELAGHLEHHTALGEQSVLKYLKGSFPGEVRASMLSVAIDRLFKALFGG